MRVGVECSDAYAAMRLPRIAERDESGDRKIARTTLLHPSKTISTYTYDIKYACNITIYMYILHTFHIFLVKSSYVMITVHSHQSTRRRVTRLMI